MAPTDEQMPPPGQPAPIASNDDDADSKGGATATVGGDATVLADDVTVLKAEAVSPPPAAAGTKPIDGVKLPHVLPMLSLVLGALVILLPAMTGPLVKPFVLPWLIPVFVWTSGAAVLLILVSVLLGALNATDARGWSHYVRGVGYFAGFAALGGLLVFVAQNHWDNATAKPVVLDYRLTPLPLVAGGVAAVELDVLNKTGKPLAYRWRFNGADIQGRRTAYLPLPDQPGRYQLEVFVSWESGTEESVDTAVAGKTVRPVPSLATLLDVLPRPVGGQTDTALVDGGTNGNEAKQAAPGGGASAQGAASSSASR